MKTNVEDCKILNIQKETFSFGNITEVEYDKSIPFKIKRIYYLYDIPGGSMRGAHAHKKGGYQLLIAVSGSFEVILDDGINKKRIKLNKANHGLLVVPGLWRKLKNFSAGAVCLVFASYIYDESDYIRDYRKFLLYKNND